MKKKKDKKQFEFYYEVTDEQIREHRQRSVKQIFEWLESTNELLQKLQTPEERERMFKIRSGNF